MALKLGSTFTFPDRSQVILTFRRRSARYNCRHIGRSVSVCRSPNSLIALDRYSDGADSDVGRPFFTVPRSLSTRSALRSTARAIYSFQAQNNRFRRAVFPLNSVYSWALLRYKSAILVQRLVCATLATNAGRHSTVVCFNSLMPGF